MAVRVAWEASKATEAKIADARAPQVEKGGGYPGEPTPAKDTDPTGGNDQDADQLIQQLLDRYSNNVQCRDFVNCQEVQEAFESDQILFGDALDSDHL